MMVKFFHLQARDSDQKLYRLWTYRWLTIEFVKGGIAPMESMSSSTTKWCALDTEGEAKIRARYTWNILFFFVLNKIKWSNFLFKQGDSGGPLMLEKLGKWYLIGIVSAGYSCAQPGQPGIYHRVAKTVDWISYVINS